MFLGSLLTAYFHIILPSNAQNAVSDNLIFKVIRGGMPSEPPRDSHLRRLFGPSPLDHPLLSRNLAPDLYNPNYLHYL